MALPYLSFYSYTFSNYQANDGSIINIQILGGISPYFVTITGPNGYIQNYVSPPVIPDLLNLEPGTYTILVSDAGGDVMVPIEIVIEEKPETFLTANISNACSCPNCDCVLTVSDYIHNSECFKYELFDGDNPVPVATYEGCKGDEYYQFTGLCTGDYRIVATETDEVLYTFNNPYDCDPGEVKIDDSLDVATIVSTWRRFAIADSVFDFNFNSVNNSGVDVLEVNGGGWSGALPDNTIEYTNHKAFFYTGFDPLLFGTPGYANITEWNAQLTIAGETLTTRFIGSFSGGVDGETPNSIGGVDGTDVANNKKYFYNLDNNKFVFVANIDFVTSKYGWVTFQAEAPIETLPGDPLKWPNATSEYTTVANWDAVPIGTEDYTIDPLDDNKVKLASLITEPVSEKIQCAFNTTVKNGYYSDCKYITYTHEVTINSNFKTEVIDGDDDFISILLARTVDDNGISHFLSLDFDPFGQITNQNPSVSIEYNAAGFQDREQSIYTFNNGETDINLFQASPFVIKKTGAEIPISGDFWVTQGSVRVRITRSGSQGQNFKIEMTDTMGDKSGDQVNATKDLGEENDFNDAYTIEFQLDDPVTWLSAPAYANGDELLKFLGPNEFGYSTFSQPDTAFFHLNFIGEQSNTEQSIVEGLNAVNEYTAEEPCDLCYLATNCENPAEQVLVTIPAEFPALDTSVTYVFNEFPDKCWTVEESDECGGGASSSILVNTGFIDASQNLGVEDQQDFNWEVIQGDVPVPTPAIITNQSFPGYGTLFNALWINQLVSPHLVGISQPSIYETTFVLPSGFNPTFTFELLSDVRAIVTLNGFIIADNSNPVSYPDPLGTPATFTTSNPIHFNPSPAINTLQVSVSTAVEEKNGFVLAGAITSPGDPLESTPVTIQEIFACCAECTKTCYELTDCEGEKDPIQTNTDLSQYVGQVITILTCPETCWTVTEIECPTVTDTVYIKDAFIDCVSCLPSPEPVTPFEVKARTVKPGYNTKGCSPEYVEKISCDYSEALYQEVITKRYGIEFCCSLDFDALDIKKQLMDFKMITDPEACVRIECCPPCNVEAELLTFNPISCPPPFGIQATLVIGDD